MQLDELFYPQLAQAVLGDQVCRVHLTGDLAKVDSSQAYRLMDPQGVGVQVPQFAQALP